MKLSKKLLTLTALGATLPIVTTSIVSCSCYMNKYSIQVRNVVKHLVEMNKKARCTDKNPTSSPYLDDIRAYIKKEAVKAGVAEADIKTDNYGNLWFDVKASNGCDNFEPLILQAHMDMVVDGMTDAEKSVKPIDTVVDWKNGIVHSKNYKTTLGADDGAGVAIMLTLIQDKTVLHGPLRLLFTANEDSGMIGAGYIADQTHEECHGLLTDYDGKEIHYLLNIDAENVGEAYQSCCGSITYDFSTTYDPSNEGVLGKKCYIQIKGLNGGHSGDIVPAGYGNAEKMTFEILEGLIDAGKSAQLVKNYHPDGDRDISFARNQVVSQSKVLFNSDTDVDTLKSVVETKIADFKTRFAKEDWNKVSITYGLDGDFDNSKFISKAESHAFIDKLGKNVAPDETEALASNVWYGYTKTVGSYGLMSANIAPLNIYYDATTNKFKVELNSQVRTEKNIGLAKMKSFYKGFKIKDTAETKTYSEYPAWEVNPDVDNRMVNWCCESYKKHGITPAKSHSTGGVEPTWWLKCNENLHVSSIGPTIKDAHHDKETLHIDTIEPVINVVKDIFDKMSIGVNKM